MLPHVRKALVGREQYAAFPLNVKPEMVVGFSGETLLDHTRGVMPGSAEDVGDFGGQVFVHLDTDLVHASLLAERNDIEAVHRLRCKVQSRLDVLVGQLRIAAQHILEGISVGDASDDHADGHTSPGNARVPMMDIGIATYALAPARVGSHVLAS